MDELLKPFIAGFDLAGQRQKDGALKPYGNVNQNSIPDWPKEVTLFGTTYTLEKVVKGDHGYESGMYV